MRTRSLKYILGIVMVVMCSGVAITGTVMTMVLLKND